MEKDAATETTIFKEMFCGQKWKKILLSFIDGESRMKNKMHLSDIFKYRGEKRR